MSAFLTCTAHETRATAVLIMQTNRSVAELEFTNTRKGGSGEEEDEPGDRRAEGATESLQRKTSTSWRERYADWRRTTRWRITEEDFRRDVSHQNLCEYVTAFWTVLTDFCMNKTVLQILSDYCPVLFKHLVSSSFTENDPLKPIMKIRYVMYNIIHFTKLIFLKITIYNVLAYIYF